MIAVDTSTLSALLGGEQGKDVDLLADALARGDVRLPPVVLTEILSDPTAATLLAPKLLDLELLDSRKDIGNEPARIVPNFEREDSRRRSPMR